MAELNEQLSDRELEVLEMVAEGAPTKEIAPRLFISPNTVKVHLRNINKKLGAQSRTEAVRIAIEQGIIQIANSDQPEIDPQSETSTATITAPLDQPVEITHPNGGPLTTAEVTGDVAAGGTLETATLAPAPQANARLYLIGSLIFLAALLGIIAFLVIDPTDTPPAVEVIASPDFAAEALGDQWFSSPIMSQPVSDPVAVSMGTNLFVIGGQSATGEVLDDVNIYFPLDKRWQAGVQKPTAVFGAAGAELNDLIYAIGGTTSAGQPTEIAEVYSPVEEIWGQIEPLPEKTAEGLAIADGSFLYHIGGVTTGCTSAASYRYEPSSNSWTELPPLPEPRASAAGGFLTGKLYVIGGYNAAGEPTSDCFLFDIAASLWERCPSTLAARANGGSATILNKLYLLGGATDTTKGEIFNPETGVWQSDIQQPMVQAGNPNWAGLGVANIESQIYIFGGIIADQATANSYLYKPLVNRIFIPAAAIDEDE